MKTQLKVFALIYHFKNNLPEFLLLENNSAEGEPMSGKFFVVTGSVEENESLEEAVVREIFEETAIQDIVKITPLNKIFEYQSLDGLILNLEHAFKVEVGNADIKLSKEHISYQWCSPEEFIERIYWIGEKTELISWVNNI